MREWECVNVSTSAALGFCLSAAGTGFTDQEDESWEGRWGGRRARDKSLCLREQLNHVENYECLSENDRKGAERAAPWVEGKYHSQVGQLGLCFDSGDWKQQLEFGVDLVTW